MGHVGRAICLCACSREDRAGSQRQRSSPCLSAVARKGKGGYNDVPGLLQHTPEEIPRRPLEGAFVLGAVGARPTGFREWLQVQSGKRYGVIVTASRPYNPLAWL